MSCQIQSHCPIFIACANRKLCFHAVNKQCHHCSFLIRLIPCRHSICQREITNRLSVCRQADFIFRFIRQACRSDRDICGELCIRDRQCTYVRSCCLIRPGSNAILSFRKFCLSNLHFDTFLIEQILLLRSERTDIIFPEHSSLCLVRSIRCCMLQVKSHLSPDIIRALECGIPGNDCLMLPAVNCLKIGIFRPLLCEFFLCKRESHGSIKLCAFVSRPLCSPRRQDIAIALSTIVIQSKRVCSISFASTCRTERIYFVEPSDRIAAYTCNGRWYDDRIFVSIS